MAARERSVRIAGLLIAVLIPLIVGGLGGLATGSSVGNWYPTLTKPSWNPPSWLFGPVWTTLFLLMGVASWRVWVSQRVDLDPPNSLGLYGLQLLFNLAWSVLFFGFRRPDLALLEIGVLLVLVLGTTLRFYQADRLAGWLLIPYLAWTSFAALLNASIWWLNR